MQLTTGTKTVSDIRIVSPMGLEVIANDLSIRSGSPAGIQLYGDVSDMLTSSTQGVNMELNMYDLYGNVYDGDQIFSVDILVDASNTLTVPSDMVSLEVGKETQVFSVYPNNRAGRGFVYANIRDDAGQLLAGSDVYPITVYTSLSERNIGNMDINVVKSYLLGESYGDMTQEKYLAGEWLYSDADTRTLSVTSLSDTPYQTLPWFHLQPTGEIVSLATPDGVVPPVVSAQIVDGYIETTVSDGRQNSHIATLLPRFTSDAFLYQGCNGQSIVDGICDELPASNYVFVASAPGIDLKGDEQ